MGTILIILINVGFYLYINVGHRNILDYGISVSTKNQLYRHITSMFTHANLMHIFMNMYNLFYLGRSIESFTGTPKFIILYLVLGILTTEAALVVKSMTGNDVISVGASGAIYALYGFYLAILTSMYGLNAVLNSGTISTLLILVAMNFVPGIDGYAHTCGIIIGIIFGIIGVRML